MTTPAYRRHDISDKVWEKLEPHLPGKKVHGEALRELTGSLTIPYFGLCEQKLPGEIFLPTMAAGAIPTVALSDAGQRCVGKIAGDSDK